MRKSLQNSGPDRVTSIKQNIIFFMKFGTILVNFLNFFPMKTQCDMIQRHIVQSILLLN